MSCQNGLCSMRKKSSCSNINNNNNNYNQANNYDRNYNTNYYNRQNNTSSLSCPKYVPILGNRPAGPMGYYVANSKPRDNYFNIRDPPDMNFWRRFG